MTLSAKNLRSHLISLVARLAEGYSAKNLSWGHDLWETMQFRLIDFYSLIEERFDLTIPNEEIDKWQTIRDVVNFLLAQVNYRQEGS